MVCPSSNVPAFAAASLVIHSGVDVSACVPVPQHRQCGFGFRQHRAVHDLAILVVVLVPDGAVGIEHLAEAARERHATPGMRVLVRIGFLERREYFAHAIDRGGGLLETEVSENVHSPDVEMHRILTRAVQQQRKYLHVAGVDGGHVGDRFVTPQCTVQHFITMGPMLLELLHGNPCGALLNQFRGPVSRPVENVRHGPGGQQRSQFRDNVGARWYRGQLERDVVPVFHLLDDVGVRSRHPPVQQPEDLVVFVGGLRYGLFSGGRRQPSAHEYQIGRHHQQGARLTHSHALHL